MKRLSHRTKRTVRDRGLLAPSPSGAVGDDLEWAKACARKGWDNIELLTESELRFVDSFGMRLQRYGARTEISDRQKDWLKRIVAKIDARTESAPDRADGGTDGPE